MNITLLLCNVYCFDKRMYILRVNECNIDLTFIACLRMYIVQMTLYYFKFQISKVSKINFKIFKILKSNFYVHLT